MQKPEFMDAFEVAILRSEAERIERNEQDEAQKQEERNSQLKATGRERLQTLIPTGAKAIIIAELHRDESDSMTDYFSYRTERTVILGFSTHTKDLFSEMRKYAANFEATAYLAEENEKFEHREKYTGGDGYYLGESKYRGWTVQKERFYGEREQYIERYALIAGDEANICVKAKVQTGKVSKTEAASETVTGDFIIVDYSEKAIAVFGDTRAVKDQLKAADGRFNPNLTHEGGKKAGS
jgi:ribonuclease BN (tRNA processing enzyme)